MTKIYHNPRCSKSRQTLGLLQEKESDIEVIEYLKTPPSEDDLRDIIRKLKIRPEQLIRKGEDIYRKNYKGRQLTSDQWIRAMIKDPVLIERPIVVKDGMAIVGRPPENVFQLY